MVRRTAIAAFILLLVPLNRIAAQDALPANVTQQLQGLQTSLGEWQRELNGFDFGALSLNEHWVDRLTMDRTACVDWMNSSSGTISLLVNEKQLILTRELVLLRDLDRTEDCLFKLHDFLIISYWGQGPVGSDPAANPPISMRWVGQIGSWISQLSEGGLEADAIRRTHEFDVAETPGKQ